MHGGTAPIGPALPQYKDGRYSKLFPPRMLSRYHQSERDAERLALAAEVAGLDARIADVLSRVDTGESGRLWSRLRATHASLLAAKAQQDAATMNLALIDLGDLIQRGHGDWAAWADVRSMWQERRKLVESERKRLVEAQQMMSTQEAMVLVSALISAVTDHVDDRDTLRAIAAEVGRIIGRPLPGGAVVAGGTASGDG